MKKTEKVIFSIGQIFKQKTNVLGEKVDTTTQIIGGPDAKGRWQCLCTHIKPDPNNPKRKKTLKCEYWLFEEYLDKNVNELHRMKLKRNRKTSK